MSFLARIAARVAPKGAALSPKGVARRSPLRRNAAAPEQPEEEAQTLRRETMETPEGEEAPTQALRRQSESAEEEAQPLRRQAEAEPEKDAAQPVRRKSETGEEDALTLRRAEEITEEDQPPAQPLRRQDGDPEEGDTQALHRQADTGQEEEAQPVRRKSGTDEEDALSLRRQEGDEPDEAADAQALRRETQTGEDDDAQPLRRAPVDPPEEDSPAQPLRRDASVDAGAGQEEDDSAQPVHRAPQGLDPETAPFPEEMRGEEAARSSRAMRHEAPAAVAPVGAASMSGELHAPDTLSDPMPGFDQMPGDMSDPVSEAFKRPTVNIDQLDVLIHEPGGPHAESSTGLIAARSRAIRARYLRRL
jgi:hypothetical protein